MPEPPAPPLPPARPPAAAAADSVPAAAGGPSAIASGGASAIASAAAADGPSLLLLGIDFHSAPIELRERVAYREDEAEQLLVHLLARSEIAEAMLLSTCNRTEVLLQPRDEEGAYRAALDLVFLRRAFGPFSAREKRHIAENLGEYWGLNADAASDMIEKPLTEAEEKTLTDLNEFDFDV